MTRAVCGTSRRAKLTSMHVLAVVSFTLHSLPCIWFWRHEWVARVWLGCLSVLVIFNGGSFAAYSARKHRRALESIVKAEHDAKIMRRCRNCGYINVKVQDKPESRAAAAGGGVISDSARTVAQTSPVHHR